MGDQQQNIYKKKIGKKMSSPQNIFLSPEEWLNNIALFF